MSRPYAIACYVMIGLFFGLVFALVGPYLIVEIIDAWAFLGARLEVRE